jgi:excisionase family DNA binding protein
MFGQEVNDMAKSTARRARPTRNLELKRIKLFEKPTGVRRLVPLKEACAYARMGRDTLYKWIRAGRIDAYKDGSRTLIDLNSVDKFHNSLPRIMLR